MTPTNETLAAELEQCTIISAGWGTAEPELHKRLVAFLRLSAGVEAEICKRCGHQNAVWSAPSPLWNAVMRGGCINGEPIFGDMVCAACFMVLAGEHGVASAFRVTAISVDGPLQTTTPSGRVWDDDAWLWDSIPTPAPAAGDGQ